MGTRGFLSFVYNGVEKTTYQQFDSYPSGVGIDVLEYLRRQLEPTDEDCQDATPEAVYEAALGELKTMVERLRVVKDGVDNVTPADIAALAPWTDFNVSKRMEPDDLPEWYQLTRRAQGQPGEILASGYLCDASDFPRDSLWAEWGYVIDLDDGDLEVYKGFQTEPHDVGRFADREPMESLSGTVYYPVKRIAAWPLDELPTNEDFVLSTDPDYVDG